MKIIKRNGAEVAFDIQKIERAITKANNSVTEADRMTPVQIGRIAESVELQWGGEAIWFAPVISEVVCLVMALAFMGRFWKSNRTLAAA